MTDLQVVPAAPSPSSPPALTGAADAAAAQGKAFDRELRLALGEGADVPTPPVGDRGSSSPAAPGPDEAVDAAVVPTAMGGTGDVAEPAAAPIHEDLHADGAPRLTSAVPATGLVVTAAAMAALASGSLPTTSPAAPATAADGATRSVGPSAPAAAAPSVGASLAGSTSAAGTDAVATLPPTPGAPAAGAVGSTPSAGTALIGDSAVSIGSGPQAAPATTANDAAATATPTASPASTDADAPTTAMPAGLVAAAAATASSSTGPSVGGDVAETTPGAPAATGPLGAEAPVATEGKGQVTTTGNDAATVEPAPLDVSAVEVTDPRATLADPDHVAPERGTRVGQTAAGSAAEGAGADLSAGAPTDDLDTPWGNVAGALRRVRQLPDGTHTIKVDLHPAELGTVRVEVQSRNGVLGVHLVAESAAGREALNGSLHQLRSDLTLAGLDIDGLGVGSHGSKDLSAGGQPGGDATGNRGAGRAQATTNNASTTPSLHRLGTLSPQTGVPGQLDVAL